jgi:hypothetical protein
MELIRAADGEAEQLRFSGTRAGVSALSGKVKRASTGGDGITHLPSTTGSTGVQKRLTDPPFVIGTISAAAVDSMRESDDSWRSSPRCC